jgi:predicted HAD superfamily Cof-like phosphohydrolase
MLNYDPQGDVDKFMKACGQDLPDSPTLPSKEILWLRARLIFEEALEFVYAAGCRVIAVVNKDGDEINWAKGGLVVDPSYQQPDLVEMMDACADINYVAYGAASACGVELAECHAEVQRSNMSKVSPDGSVKRRPEDGKIMKPDTYSPPDLVSVIAAQKLKKAK